MTENNKIYNSKSNGEFWDDILDNNVEFIDKDFDEEMRVREQLKTKSKESIIEQKTQIVDNQNKKNDTLSKKNDDHKQINKKNKSSKPKLNIGKNKVSPTNDIYDDDDYDSNYNIEEYD